MRISRGATVLLTAGLLSAATDPVPVDWAMVARIREEGLQRSRVMDYEGYMTDVLGARLTLSRDMQRAQGWAQEEMKRLGLAKVHAEPFMDYGVAWDNEYVSVQMLEPDYSPMTAYPLSHTPGTRGRQVLEVVIADAVVRDSVELLKGKLRGKAVLMSPLATIDLKPLIDGTPRLSDAELREREQVVITPARPAPARRNPAIMPAAERIAFYKAEGAAVVLQCESGWLAAVRGFSRPGAREDGWSREGILNSLPIIAVTPEHYNRMYRNVRRAIPVKVEVEVRNRIGEKVEQAVNITGEIPGSDLKDEIVMIGAHFDTWHASPNASDNTSGVAVVLEAARILQAVGATPRRTIRVALWSGEEQGLFGSRAYVKSHFGPPGDPSAGLKAGYENIYAYFNQDYGPGQYRGIYLQGNERARPLLTAWMEPFRDFGMTTVSNQSVGSTDHVAFDEAGFPGFQFLQDRVPGTGGHTNLDFYDTIQAEDLMKNAVVMASYAWHAAMSDAPMPRKEAVKR